MDAALTSFQITFDQAQPATAFAGVATPGFLAVAASFWLDASAGVAQAAQPGQDNIDSSLSWLSRSTTSLTLAAIHAAQTQFNGLAMTAAVAIAQTAIQSQAAWNYLVYDFNPGTRAQGLLRVVSGFSEFLACDAVITASGGLAALTAGLSAPLSAIGVLGGALTAVHGLDQVSPASSKCITGHTRSPLPSNCCNTFMRIGDKTRRRRPPTPPASTTP